MHNCNRIYSKHSILIWMVDLCVHSTSGGSLTNSLTGVRAGRNLSQMAITLKWHLASISMWKRECQGKTQTHGGPKKIGLPKTKINKKKEPRDAGTSWIGFIFPCHIAVRQVTAGGGTDSSALPHSASLWSKATVSWQLIWWWKTELSASSQEWESASQWSQKPSSDTRTPLFLKLWKSMMKQEKLYI